MFVGDGKRASIHRKKHRHLYRCAFSLETETSFHVPYLNFGLRQQRKAQVIGLVTRNPEPQDGQSERQQVEPAFVHRVIAPYNSVQQCIRLTGPAIACRP